MNQNELYHTDVYRGESFSDELYHWKYMSRKWKNGRWVYTYKNEEYEKAKKAKSKAESNRNVKSLKYASAHTNTKSQRQLALKDGKVTRKEAQKYTENKMKEESRKDAYDKAETKYAKAEKKYKNVKIKTLPSRAVGKGAAAIANLGSILSSKVRSLGKPKKKKKGPIITSTSSRSY